MHGGRELNAGYERLEREAWIQGEVHDIPVRKDILSRLSIP